MDTLPKTGTSVPHVRTFRIDAASAGHGPAVAHRAEQVVDTMPAARVHEPKPQRIPDPDTAFDIRSAASGSEDGIIVKDTRRKRWSLSKEIGKSVGAWAHEAAGSFTDKEHVVPRVAPAAERAAVIASAGEKSHLAPADDHTVVVQKLRTFAKDAERVTGKPFVLKTDIPEEPPTWKHINERPEGAPPSPIQEGATRILKSFKQARPVRSTTLSNRENVIAKSPHLAVAPEARQTLPDRVFDETFVARPEERPRIATPTYREPIPDALLQKPAPQIISRAEQPEDAAEKERPAAPQRQTRDISFALPTFSKEETTPVRTLRNDAIEDVEERQLSVPRIASAEAKRRTTRKTDVDLRTSPSLLPVAGAVVGIVFLVTVSVVAYLHFREPGETPIEVVRIPSFITTSAQIPVPLVQQREEFLRAMAAAVAGASGSSQSLVQLYPTIGSDAVPARTGAIMDVLDITAPGALVRALDEDMMFGAYIGTSRAPFIVLKVRQFDTAFAGMLSWEEFMSADLAPLFGEPVRRTLDPTARTNDQTRSARFVDATIRNQDVRILFDEVGEERVLYSFVDERTIFITASSDAFVALVDAVR